ncbi:hypothetical protein BDC45DRAFT_587381 [Circinella umbellata]|nr:hypothetical protein BDC45DRAFT_587381 [Circinella umbellata]
MARNEGLWPALRSYRTFIRPVLEYDLAIAALSPNQLEKLDNAQKGCIKMAFNRKTSKHSATIVPMVLADLPSIKLRARIPTQQPHPVINEKRDEEYDSRRTKFKAINCLRTKRIIDPILYLPAFPKDRHRLIKWRMHWLPSYSLKDCRCGQQAAHRTHFLHSPLLEPHMQELLDQFGTIPPLPYNIQPLDHILNSLPRSEVELAIGNWSKIWPALIHVLRKIDSLRHSDDIFDDDEPAPQEAMDIIPTTAAGTLE